MSKLIFDKEAVEEVKHPLVRLLRLVLFKNNITLDDYLTAFNRHAKFMSMSTKDLNSERTNNLKALNRFDRVTFQKFHQILVTIFRFELIEFSVTFRKPDGQQVTYSSNDPV